MKALKDFSILEYLTLQPLKFFYKDVRNDFLLNHYCHRDHQAIDTFLKQNTSLKGSNILVVIAFEQVEVLTWLFEFSKKNLTEFQLIIFDNSRNLSKKVAIEELCEQEHILYFSLPNQSVKHPNRSHGMAMTWVYQNFIQKIEPSIFGYLDHDMIPLAPVHIKDKLIDRVCYGALNPGFGIWNLWAGYCFFNYEKVRKLKLNFLYDFSRGVDTGGRNWDVLYSRLSDAEFSYASNQYVSLNIDGIVTPYVQIIDHAWLHIGGVSYNKNMMNKQELARLILDYSRLGNSIEQMLTGGICA